MVADYCWSCVVERARIWCALCCLHDSWFLNFFVNTIGSSAIYRTLCQFSYERNSIRIQHFALDFQRRHSMCWILIGLHKFVPNDVVIKESKKKIEREMGVCGVRRRRPPRAFIPTTSTYFSCVE